MFEGSLEDRVAIRELYGCYSDAAMRQDRTLYLSLWCEDGIRTTRDGDTHGKPAIAQHWDGIWSIVNKMGFFSEIAAISASGTTAKTRVFCREIITLHTGDLWKVLGQYDDVLEKIDGRWLFKHRKYELVLDERAIVQSAP